MDPKTERFGLALSPAEKLALERLADRERISAAAVIRRLIWRAAKTSERREAREPELERCNG